MKSALEQLQEMTVIVADTGDASLVKHHKPQDCTTNPSLVLAALSADDAQDLIASEVATARSRGMDVATLCRTLTVAIGAKLTTLVPGRVSTEVDARLSFDVEGSIRQANEIVEDYANRGVGSDRILIKLASTWEGIRAAEQLQKAGIDCNLTLLFALEQAKACADAGVFLISPFVGRITDWYKKATGVEDYLPEEDPGVKSVRGIHEYYKSHGINTIVMGASFRNTDQIKSLAGCDRLTIAPKLLAELGKDTNPVPRMLNELSASTEENKTVLRESDFRWGMNQSAMATEKLSEGIRNFNADHQKLLGLLAQKI
ncbi:transaldolase [Marinovum sp. 2_MG-2023]|uniref:transaldolase n=1 Tax=unclassified Marinovum TaxID=2647166 RepID=UPI0026E1F862|nr:MULTISPECIES: transaldolase [unclassified Marinovum]MDO6732180.1 transaldolase [Marinovum sp. 2_MG-2023]MDO6781497.1 transaldolase [Marinovum sp. 1_MG-2023]